MKKHLSVFMLSARSVIGWELAIIALMGAAETALFYLTATANPGFSPESLISSSRLPLASAAGFILLCALFCVTGSEYGGARTRYTLRRLAVSERSVTLWWSLCFTFGFLIFWAAQTGIAALLCLLFTRLADPSAVNGQTVFLAFYRSPFLHALLPLEEWGRYILNALLALSLGVACACFSARARRDERGVAAPAIAILLLVFFSGELGRQDTGVVLAVVSLVTTGMALLGVWGRANES